VGVHGIYVEFLDPALSSGVNNDDDDIPLDIPTGDRITFASLDDLPALVIPHHSTAILACPRGRAKYSATFLPDVLPAQGWTQLQAIDSAIEKSGWKKEITEQLRRSIRLTRYQSSKCEADYAEWQDWRISQ
jgi:hypothetical protein